jgi:ATP-dependent helicase Lhr and Lhr-like helicase
VEQTRSREGHHLFLYPFEGRLVHEGLAALLAWRLTREAPRSIRVSANDHGLELVCPEPIPLDREGWDRLLSPGLLTDDLLHCMNAAELARRRFREIARVAGLLFPGYPGRAKGTRQLQASGELLFDVLRRYDPGNLLLDQADREVLEGMLEVRRLEGLLERLAGAERIVLETPRLTPFAFPIWAERMQAEVSSERWIDRVQRMAVRLERAASARGGGGRRGVEMRVETGDAAGWRCSG